MAAPWTIRTAHEALVNKSISSRELTEAYLARIAKYDTTIGAYLDTYTESALVEADAADARLRQGSATALTGIPFAVKDLIMIAGRRCTAGSQALAEYQAAFDATVVTKLKDAGAVFLGKTSLDEFAMGSSNENTSMSQTKNPWDKMRVPGGSSGGSAAAVAADECVAALGTDTGGSVRQPASFCGVVGLKPTYGRVSRHGVIGMTSSLDQVGPLTKSVYDAAIVFNATCGQDRYDSTTAKNNKPIDITELDKPITGMKIGLPEEFFIDGMDPAVKALIDAGIQKLTELGAQIIPVSLPLTQYALAVYQITLTSEVSSNLARYDGMRYGLSVSADQLIDVYQKSRAAGFGSEVKRRIMLGTFALSAGYHDRYYVQAQKLRTMMRQQYTDIFKKVDCLVSPTSPSVAFLHGEKMADPLMMYLSDIYTVPANIASICAISVPAGLAHGLPAGIQFMAPAFAETRVCQVAHQYEQATSWHTLQPKLD